jgi:hypothetical protein
MVPGFQTSSNASQSGADECRSACAGRQLILTVHRKRRHEQTGDPSLSASFQGGDVLQ